MMNGVPPDAEANPSPERKNATVPVPSNAPKPLVTLAELLTGAPEDDVLVLGLLPLGSRGTASNEPENVGLTVRVVSPGPVRERFVPIVKLKSSVVVAPCGAARSVMVVVPDVAPVNSMVTEFKVPLWLNWAISISKFVNGFTWL